MSDGEGYIRRTVKEEIDRVDARMEKFETELRTLKDYVIEFRAEQNLRDAKKSWAAAGWSASVATAFTVLVNWAWSVIRP